MPCVPLHDGLLRVDCDDAMDVDPSGNTLSTEG